LLVIMHPSEYVYHNPRGRNLHAFIMLVFEQVIRCCLRSQYALHWNC